MLGSVLVVLLLTQAASQSAPAATDEVRDVLKQAETLYYDARFSDSINLLVGLDERLQKEPNRQPERIATKLQLVLAYVGLNRVDQAKTVMRQLYSLDKNYSLDPLLYAPKIIALADAAKAEMATTHCETDRSAVVKSIEKGDIDVVIDRMHTIKSDCPDLAGMDAVVIDVLYQRGVESVKKAQYSEALRKFDAVLKLSPDNDLAKQYIAVVNTRVQLETERLALEWQKSFAAREFATATAVYRELKSIDQPVSAEAIKRIDADYRDSVVGRLQDAHKACERGDERTVAAIRDEVTQILPEPSLAADILSEPMDCTRVCLPSTERLAMRRLETRVEPDIPRASLAGFGSFTVRVKATVNENGTVSVTSVDGEHLEINGAVQTAVERWKFNPAYDQNGHPRCVEIEIPILIKP